MFKAITLRAFPPQMRTIERVKLARAAGYQGIELNLEEGEEYTLFSAPEELKSMREMVEGLGMQISSVYSRQQWHFPMTSQNPQTRQKSKEIIQGLARAASVVGADTILVVPGAVDNSLFSNDPEIVPYEVAYTNARTVLKELSHTVAEHYKVQLAIENVWNKFLLSPLEFSRFIDEIESQWVGVYFDVGNVLRTGFPEHWIPILGHRIKRIHFKDFRLSVDNIGGFVNLLEGDVNWPAVAASIRKIGYEGWITAEVLPPYRYHSERLIYETSASMDAILSLGEMIKNG